MEHLKRLTVLLGLILSTSLDTSGCADSTGESGDEPESAARAALTSSTEVSWSDFAVFGGTEKIRRGSPINFFNLTGNSTVMIRAEHSTEVCTAQVINKFFLLTAAHCVALVFPSGADNAAVSFTDTAGNRFDQTVGFATAFAIPNWQQGTNDIGLIFFPNGMDTCQDTFANCRNARVNTPVNAMFQVFFTGFEFAQANYSFTGYGPSDPATPTTDDLRLRIGSMKTTSSFFPDAAHDTHMIAMQWTSDSQARPCRGDSGGPLVITNFPRLLHVGVHSSGPDCRDATGAPSYSGLSNTQATWVLNTMNSQASGFHCTAGTTARSGGSILAFACDNDGQMFP